MKWLNAIGYVVGALLLAHAWLMWRSWRKR